MLVWLKRFLILGVLIGLAAAIAYPTMSWWQQRSLPKYLTASVSRGRVETVVNSTGTVKPIRTVSVGAFTSGPIEEVNVDFNSKVYKKTSEHPATVLALIDDKLLAAAVERDEAAVDTQKADLGASKPYSSRPRTTRSVPKTCKRSTPTTSRPRKWTSITLPRSPSRPSASSAQPRSGRRGQPAKFRRSTSATRKSVSPEDGIVIERKVDPGQTVAASFQTPELFTIGVEMESTCTSMPRSMRPTSA